MFRAELWGKMGALASCRRVRKSNPNQNAGKMPALPVRFCARCHFYFAASSSGGRKFFIAQTSWMLLSRPKAARLPSG